MGTFMYSIMPNDKGEIECVAQESGQLVEFVITEIDLERMKQAYHLKKLKEILAREEDRNG